MATDIGRSVIGRFDFTSRVYNKYSNVLGMLYFTRCNTLTVHTLQQVTRVYNNYYALKFYKSHFTYSIPQEQV